MKRFKKEDLKGKFVIGFDTICEGHQCGKDENDKPDPILYSSKDEAFKELFIEAVCGIEGNQFLWEEEDEELDRDTVIAEMNALIKTGDIQAMRDYMDKNPDTNYYGEFIEEAKEFVVGRKAILTSDGIVIEGTKLEDL